MNISKTTKEVTIFSQTPYPYGGVTVHTERLIELLTSIGYNVKLYPFSPFFNSYSNSKIRIIRPPSFIKRGLLIQLYYFIYFSFFDSSKIIHYHCDSWAPLFLVLCQKLFRTKVIVTIHDEMYINEMQKFKFRSYFFNKLMNSKSTEIIAVNEKILEEVKQRYNKHSLLINAYLLPTMKEEELPIKLSNFISFHNKTLLVYGASFRLYLGEDLYGFYLSIDSVKLLRKSGQDVGLVIIIPDKNSSIEVDKMNEYIKSINLSNNILIYNKPFSNLYTLLKNIDIYLRPTLTDGDSITIRESLAIGTPVVASNSTIRPEKCIIFENKNILDFTNKIVQCLYSKEKNNELNLCNDNFDKILKAYDLNHEK